MSEKLKILDFWAPWCGPCKRVGPVVDEVLSEYNNVNLVKINVDEDSDSARKYGVSSIPTLVFIKNDKIVETKTGIISKDQLKNIIEANI